MSHVNDAFRYICAHTGKVSDLDGVSILRAPHESLIDVLVKLRVLRAGGGPQRARDLRVQSTTAIYDSLYKAFMESKS